MIAPYNMAGLEDLAGQPNISAVIERIDNAATRAAALYRAVGLTLTRGRMATADDFDEMLRTLVAKAAEDCFTAQELGKSDHGRMIIDHVEGVADNEVFRVVVTADRQGYLSVDILLRLV